VGRAGREGRAALVALTVGELTEGELITRIRERLPSPPAWVLVGIGDDAAVVEPARNRVQVLSVDGLVEGVHFDRAFVPPEAIGHRALAVNLSDLASMGATPRLALLSMALPESWAVAELDEMMVGFAALAARYRLHLVGGNLTRSPGPLMIDVTVEGTVKRRHTLQRKGAHAGDELYVSGTIGAAGAGLRWLRQCPGAAIPADLANSVSRYLRPEPRVELGTALARHRAASACIDLSDGLADGVHHMAEASGIGIVVDADAIPIDAGAKALFNRSGNDAILDAATAGDDYELLFAVPPAAQRRLMSVATHRGKDRAGVPFTRIGTCTADGRVSLRRSLDSSRNDMANEMTLPRGYSHFR
jgi:thiamine-monophosphate kinase